MNPDLSTIYTELESSWENKDSIFVPGKGPVPSDVMFIAEAPGLAEVKEQSPIAGAPGSFFNKLLGFSGVKREDVFVTNLVKFYNPEATNHGERRAPKPSFAQKQASAPYLRREIETVNPKLIVTLGQSPLSVFFPVMTIGEARRELKEKFGRKILGTYHPAIVVDAGYQRIEERLRYDFKLIGNFLRSIN